MPSNNGMLLNSVLLFVGAISRLSTSHIEKSLFGQKWQTFAGQSRLLITPRTTLRRTFSIVPYTARALYILEQNSRVLSAQILLKEHPNMRPKRYDSHKISTIHKNASLRPMRVHKRSVPRKAAHSQKTYSFRLKITFLIERGR